MKMDDLNKWLTLAANLGVIAGIIFLAVELRQNSDMIRAQTRANLAEELVDLFSANMNDSDYAAVLLRGNKGLELSEVEEYQYMRHRTSWVWYWNNVVYQYEMGMYDEGEFVRQFSIIRADMDIDPGIKSHWCKNRGFVSPGLAKAVEGDSYGDYC